MKKILVILFTLFAVNGYSQIGFDDDPESFKDWYDSIYNYEKINKQFDKEFKLTKDYDFEFRLWIDPSPMTNRLLFVMKKKADNWTAGFYKNVSGRMEEVAVDQSDLDKLWGDLMRNKVLTVPTQKDVRDKMRVFSSDTLYAFGYNDPFSNGPYYDPYILDGVFYRIELRTPDKKRSYTYHCPKGYLQECPNVEELFRAYAIVCLIYRRLGLNPDNIC